MQASNESTSREVAPIQFNGAPTMSSREIADLVESRHDVVKLSIERLAKSGVISQPPLVDGPKSANGVVEKHYLVGKRDSYIVVAQLSPEFTARLVDRWQELEANQQKFDPSALTRMDILQLAMESEAGRIKAEAERDHAVATKAQIGSRREASAMGAASAAKREVVKLKDLIGEAAHRASVLAVEGATKVKSGVYDWRVLKNYCMANELEIGKAWNPGMQKDVNTYPAEAWMRCHGIDLGALFSGQRGLQ
jgi:phage regulator Rha-like protein